jgi:hypothetical protein
MDILLQPWILLTFGIVGFFGVLGNGQNVKQTKVANYPLKAGR